MPTPDATAHPDPVPSTGPALTPGHPLSASAAPITHEALDAASVVEGLPTAGYTVLDTLGDTEIGVWEMSVGTATDTEEDEVFVVVSGRASIHFSADDRTIVVGSGDVVQLTAGMHTTWTITETLRKIYVS